MSSRVGFGFDVHPFSPDDAPGRKLILGGVTFADERSLVGHSDADVVAHAIADAILGAAGLGDIGMHFPHPDARWQGADSLAILAECARLARVEGYKTTNADCTILAERPKIAPYREEMI